MMIKRLSWLILGLFFAIPAHADRLGSLTPNSQVTLSTQAILNQNTLQAGATFFVSSGTVLNQFSVASGSFTVFPNSVSIGTTTNLSLPIVIFTTQAVGGLLRSTNLQITGFRIQGSDRVGTLSNASGGNGLGVDSQFNITFNGAGTNNNMFRLYNTNSSTLYGTIGVDLTNDVVFNTNGVMAAAIDQSQSFMVGTSTTSPLFKISISSGIVMSTVAFMNAGWGFVSRNTATNDSPTKADIFVGVTDTSAPRTITLFSTAACLAVGQGGYNIIVKDKTNNAATNNITVVPATGEKIDLGTSKVISTNGQAFTFSCQSDGWWTW